MNYVKHKHITPPPPPKKKSIAFTIVLKYKADSSGKRGFARCRARLWLARLQEAELIEFNGDNLRLTRRGVLLSNEVFAAFV